MAKSVVTVAMLVLLATVSVSCGGSDTVRIGTEGAYPPFNFINEAGEIDGLERELGDELCRRADLECEWVTNEWVSMIPNLLGGEYDAILAGMSITDERDEVIDFTQPYVPPIASVYIALAGAGDGAANGRVAAQTATVQADFLADSGAPLVEFALVPEVVEAVVSGEADAALVDRGFAVQSIADSGGRLTLVGPEVPLDAGIGVGVREDDTDLKDKLNRAIDAMKADGSLNALVKEWLGSDADVF